MLSNIGILPPATLPPGHMDIEGDKTPRALPLEGMCVKLLWANNPRLSIVQNSGSRVTKEFRLSLSEGGRGESNDSCSSAGLLLSQGRY